MKPTLLQAYEKGRRIINTMTLTSLAASRHYITLFSEMFIYDNLDSKICDKARYYREDLLYQFGIKFKELC